MYQVFTDFHHAGLLQSLILLFEKRLSGDVYRPIGMEWAEQGYWKVFDHPATQLQYLGVNGATPDDSPKLNEVSFAPEEGLYICQDIDSGYYNKAITLSRFLAVDIDIVIASLPQHIEPFKKLCDLHPNKPKLIYQIGNTWDIAGNLPVSNVMASAKIHHVPDGINFISYHQEFDTNIFKPTTDQLQTKSIYSFVNCFSLQNHFKTDWDIFQKVEAIMYDWRFRCYGGGCRDGAAHGSQQVADKMREAQFIWHTKFGGDGYGHVIHNVFAMGKPSIVKKSYYEGKMAGDLLIDGETCIVIDGLDNNQIVHKILHYSDPERYAQMSRNVYAKFQDVVNFDTEEKQLAQFLENLL